MAPVFSTCSFYRVDGTRASFYYGVFSLPSPLFPAHSPTNSYVTFTLKRFFESAATSLLLDPPNDCFFPCHCLATTPKGVCHLHFHFPPNAWGSEGHPGPLRLQLAFRKNLPSLFLSTLFSATQQNKSRLRGSPGFLTSFTPSRPDPVQAAAHLPLLFLHLPSSFLRHAACPLSGKEVSFPYSASPHLLTFRYRYRMA